MSTSVKTEISLLNPQYHRNFGEIQTPKPRKLQISTASIPGLKYQAVLLCSSTQQPKFEISSYYLHHMKDCSIEGKKHSQQSGLILRTQDFSFTHHFISQSTKQELLSNQSNPK